MFQKLLIANRGEIALRIIHACRELGIQTVAVHSEADEFSLHVRFADEAICIGPAQNDASYLNASAIMSAAEISDADALHPGYGYLAENPHLIEICEACGVVFIGPSADVMRMMGDKAKAREVAKGMGIPVVPGSAGPVRDIEEAVEVSGEIGFPVIFKAVAGGGGRGMRVVYDPKNLGLAFQTARSEAAAAFSSPDLYLERYLVRPRHIEIQMLSDRHGRHAHLGERECSIQRRHQKLIEESPSPAVDEDLRQLLGGSAVRICEEIGYEGAGTVEFLLDEDGSHYFMEMNTRIQVEHPVTEMVMGFDLVKEQIRVAAGEPLSLPPGDLKPRGHAIEFRINAEDPETFVPSPGTITAFHAPGGPGVRVDTAAHAQCRISPYYDSLVAKIVVHGKDRADAIARGRRALDMTIIEGIQTNVDLHRRILAEPAFREGNFSTRFLDDLLHPEREGEGGETGDAGVGTDPSSGS